MTTWLESMRGQDGYGGPVVHWWQNCWAFTGAGLDWRYEGIITGYLNLYTKTHQLGWLGRAQQAGDDLVRGQLANGSFRNSNFELNPYPGGTPHEAAASIGLLHLAEQSGEPVYLQAAERCLRDYYIARLWDEDARTFVDGLGMQTFVPNKAATLSEALLKLTDLTGDERLITHYVLPTLDNILQHQTDDGGIYQYSEQGKPIVWFFPYYISRCIPVLFEVSSRTGEERYARGAHAALDFLARWQAPDGSLPQVVYRNGRVNHWPRWVAGLGDVARAFSFSEEHVENLQLIVNQILQGRQASGAIQTARGFAVDAVQRNPPGLPSFRDVLPVVGWVDKAFRLLTELLPHDLNLPVFHPEVVEADCVLRRRKMSYREDRYLIELHEDRRLIYRWRKGHAWAEVYDLARLWS